MKIHELRHSVETRPDGPVIRVKGTMQAGDHILPISYSVRADEDPGVHEKHLAECDEKGATWAVLREDYRALNGMAQGTATVIECDLQHHGWNDWVLYCKWTDPDGEHRKTWSYKHPAEAMPVASLLALLGTTATASVEKQKNKGNHEAALARLEGQWASHK